MLQLQYCGITMVFRFLTSVFCILQHLARASQSLGARPLGPASAVFPAPSQDGRRPPGSSMHGGHFGAQMPYLGGNQFPAGEIVRGQDLGAFNAASAPAGRAFGSAPGPVSRSALPNAIGPADPSVLFNGWQGLGGKPAPPPAAPMGYAAAYALSEPCEPTLLVAFLPAGLPHMSLHAKVVHGMMLWMYLQACRHARVMRPHASQASILASMQPHKVSGLALACILFQSSVQTSSRQPKADLLIPMGCRHVIRVSCCLSWSAC